jgi:hypothetical protein
MQPGDSDRVYFQDISSYREGVRYSTKTQNDYASYYSGQRKKWRISLI